LTAVGETKDRRKSICFGPRLNVVGKGQKVWVSGRTKRKEGSVVTENCTDTEDHTPHRIEN